MVKSIPSSIDAFNIFFTYLHVKDGTNRVLFVYIAANFRISNRIAEKVEIFEIANTN